MINETELRVGNYVLDDGKLYQVYKVEPADGTTLMPIPLTQEIMKAAGFNTDYSEDFYQMDGNELVINTNDFTMVVLNTPFEYDIQIELKSLHQLQNLYYAIIGTELMIDEQELKRSVATTDE